MSSQLKNVIINITCYLIIISSLVGCSESAPVEINNYYITNSDGSTQPINPEDNIPAGSSGNDNVTSSPESTSTSSTQSPSQTTDPSIVVGINYTVTGTKNYLAVRSAPAYDGSNEIAKMKNGDELTIQSQNVYGDKGEYCYITALTGAAKGQSGYVNNKYITPSKKEQSVSSISSSSKVSASKPAESSKATDSKLESTFESSPVNQVESAIVSEQESPVNKDTTNIFDAIPSEFTFSSGAGGWRTLININSDGSFTGNYVDYDLGDTGTDYPKGSAAICDFTGKFTNVTKIDDFSYSMKVISLVQEGTKGDEYIEDGTRFTVSHPYGFDDADEFMLYLPGKPISELSDDFLSWVQFGRRGEQAIPDGTYGLYNVNGKEGFTGTK